MVDEKPSGAPPPEGVWVVYVIVVGATGAMATPTRYLDTKVDAQRFCQELGQQVEMMSKNPAVRNAFGLCGVENVRVEARRVLRHSPLELGPMQPGPILVGKA